MNAGKGKRRDNTVKNGISARLLFALTAVLLSFGLFCACSNADGITPEEDGELVQYFRDKLTETLPSPDGENVYWVRSGSVYHLTPDCEFIAGDEDIICSGIAESGKTRLCSACEKAALSAESGDGVLPDGMEDAVADGIRLIAVGDHGIAAHHPDGVIDNEGGVGHFGRVEGLGADAVRGLHEDPVAGVLAASHDKIGNDGLLPVGGAAQHDAASGIGVAA